jgi:putative ATP-binding cassette transporter
VAAPFYFAGKIELGIMTQTASAFGRVEGALNFFVTYYTSLADFKAVLDRLSSFDESIEQARTIGRETQIAVTAGESGALAVSHLTLGVPDGRVIVTDVNMDLPVHQGTLVLGPSGSGKSTLFRAIAGIWPYGKGTIRVPAGARVMLLPQKPYVPTGSLRAAVTYPSGAGAYDDEAVRAALEAARLGAFIDRLDEEGNWPMSLSGGEQQRLAIARALLARPDWLFLDEATTAIDEASETAIYQMLAEELPDTTIVSISHRSALAAFHARQLEMRPTAEGTSTISAAEMPTAAQ